VKWKHGGDTNSNKKKDFFQILSDKTFCWLPNVSEHPLPTNYEKLATEMITLI